MAANLSFFDILQINSNLNYANGRISISNFSTPELANYTKRTAASPLLSHLSLSHPLSFEFFFSLPIYTYLSYPVCGRRLACFCTSCRPKRRRPSAGTECPLLGRSR
jgi:hypothetical protein